MFIYFGNVHLYGRLLLFDKHEFVRKRFHRDVSWGYSQGNDNQSRHVQCMFQCVKYIL